MATSRYHGRSDRNSKTYLHINLQSVTLSLHVRPRPNVELYVKLSFRSTYIKLRGSLGSDVELRTRRTNQLNQITNIFSPERG